MDAQEPAAGHMSDAKANVTKPAVDAAAQAAAFAALAGGPVRRRGANRWVHASM